MEKTQHMYFDVVFLYGQHFYLHHIITVKGLFNSLLKKRVLFITF